jgi:hypothetical protein
VPLDPCQCADHLHLIGAPAPGLLAVLSERRCFVGVGGLFSARPAARSLALDGLVRSVPDTAGRHFYLRAGPLLYRRTHRRAPELLGFKLMAQDIVLAGTKRSARPAYGEGSPCGVTRA